MAEGSRISRVSDQSHRPSISQAVFNQQGDTMTVTQRYGAIGLAIGLAMTMATSVVSGHDSHDKRAPSSNAGDRTIAGVWRTMVTPRNCQTGEQVATSFPGLFTFNSHGTMSEYGIGPGSSPALRSPGHGVWQREHRWQDYSFAFTYYRYNAGGVFIGSQKVTAALELGAGGDVFTTTSGIEVFDAGGNLIATACATAAGSRFE